MHGLMVAAVGIATAPSRLVRPATPPHGVAGMPIPLAPATPPPLDSAPVQSIPASLSGEDLLQIPNVFRGVSSSGTVLEHRAPLGREEELEVRCDALRQRLALALTLRSVRRAPADKLTPGRPAHS